MSFLDDALSAAKADLTAKRASGKLHGQAAKPKSIRSKHLADRELLSKWKRQRHKYNEAQSATLRLNEYDLERSSKALEEKTKRYNQMYKSGSDMTLNDEDKDTLLVNFDQKWAEGHRQDSDEEVEEPEAPESEDDIPGIIIRGPHLQSFVPDAAKKDEIWAEDARQAGPVHYDPSFELRDRGSGYINLGRGQDRDKRIDELLETRAETTTIRQKRGFDVDEDVRPNRTAEEEHAKRVAVGGAFLDSLF